MRLFFLIQTLVLIFPLGIKSEEINLDSLWLQGKIFYEKGITQNKIPVEAHVSGTKVPASLLVCASCHGADGKGRPEGGVYPPDINWKTLSKNYDSIQINGRVSKPYAEKDLTAAVCLGRDPSGNNLDIVMPRFSLVTYLPQKKIFEN